MSLLYRLARGVGRRIGPDSALARAGRPLTEHLIRWTVGRRGLAWEINGAACRIDPRFRAQFARTYDAELAQFLGAKIKPGQTCLDVGANIGAWVIQFACWVGTQGRVIAFEPNPAARVVLEEHICLNHLENIVEVVPVAVGRAAAKVPFFAAGSNGMSRVGHPNPLLARQTRPITVPLVTLDEWCTKQSIRPDWLLLDVEGFEGHVLAGAIDMIRSRGAVLGIVVEMHPDLWSASDTSPDDFQAQVAAIGRRIVPLTGQTDPLAEYAHVLLEPL